MHSIRFSIRSPQFSWRLARFSHLQDSIHRLYSVNPETLSHSECRNAKKEVSKLTIAKLDDVDSNHTVQGLISSQRLDVEKATANSDNNVNIKAELVNAKSETKKQNNTVENGNEAPYLATNASMERSSSSSILYTLTGEQLQFIRELLSQTNYPSVEEKIMLQKMFGWTLPEINTLISKFRRSDRWNKEKISVFQSMEETSTSIDNPTTHNSKQVSFQQSRSGSEKQESLELQNKFSNPIRLTSKMKDERYFAKEIIYSYLSKLNRKPTKLEFISLWRQVNQVYTRKQLYHIIWDRLQGHRTVTSEDRKEILKAVKENDNQMLNNEQILPLQQLLQLSRRQIRKVIQSSLTKKGQFTDAKRQHLRSVLKDFNYNPSIQIIQQKAKELQLTPSQIRSFLQCEIQKHNPVTHEMRALLKHYFHKKDYKLLNSDFEYLSLETNLPIALLRRIFRYYRTNHKRVSAEKLKQIREWLQTCPSTPRSSQIKIFAEEIGVGYLQLNTIIRRWVNKSKEGTVTKYKENRIRDFLESHNYFASDEDIQQLAKDLQLLQSQVRNVIWKLQNPPGSITDESKHVIQEYIQTHDRTITKMDLNHLSLLTGLNSKQISGFIYRFKYKEKSFCEITDEMRKLVTSFIKTNLSISPEDVAYLQEKTGLSKNQLQSLIWRIRNKSSTRLNPELRHILESWLLKNNYKSPTQNEIRLLQEETGLSRIQIRGFINRQLKKLDIGTTK